MSRIVVLPDTDPATRLVDTDDRDVIAAELAAIGVRFEAWTAGRELADGADQAAILAAYAADIERLRAEGYTTVDAIRLARTTETDEEWTAKATGARTKFLAEHTHDDDEVRFFVEGSGIFYLHVAGRVFAVLCETGDLISVPAGTTHWFDMGTDPRFCAIRFFRIPEGWVGVFTGSDIAERFPTYDQLVAEPAGAA
jgi:1,2-dihydroxy-3-keto-5-methylthiopentene dioxygenase